MSSQHSFSRPQDAQDYRAQGDRGIGQDLDNIFRLTAAQFPSAQQGVERGRTAAPEARRVTQPDLDAALDMLNRAAKAMDLMQSRYQNVEDYAKSVAERAEKDIASALAQVREWELRASGSEGKLEEFRGRAAGGRASRRSRGAKRQGGTRLARMFLREDRVVLRRAVLAEIAGRLARNAIRACLRGNVSSTTTKGNLPPV